MIRGKEHTDINNASEQQLRDVAQIDGTRARNLVEYRDRRGSFESWDDVKQVPSYEDGMVERLQSAGFSIGHGAELRRESSRQDAANRTGSGSRSLNRASAAELEDTHMIDGERARRLVDYRDRHGAFSDWEQVKSVSGIDDGIVNRLRGEGFGLG